MLDAQCKHCVMYSTIGLRLRDVYLPECPTYKQQLRTLKKGSESQQKMNIQQEVGHVKKGED